MLNKAYVIKYSVLKTWISVIAEALEKSHLSGPGVADYFIRIYERKFEEMQDDKYPNFFDGLYEIDKFRAIGRELLWRQSARRILKNFTFGPHSESFNAREPIKLEKLLDNPVILELDLEIPKPQRTFFTEMILRFIHLYRLSQMETDRLRHVLFLEECQNLFPRTREERESSGSLENIYREIRSFGQGIVSITQHTSLLPVYILGNGNADIIVKKGKKITAIEIETEKYRAVKNVLKNLKHKCDSIISVALNDSVASAIKDELKKANLQESRRIVVTTVLSYD